MNKTIFINQFDVQLEKISTLLSASNKKKNPAVYLYEENFRAPLFQLEGLCRIYVELSDSEKPFKKMLRHFKKMEDQFGQVDYYGALAKQFVSNKQIPEEVLQFFNSQYKKQLKKLNKQLDKKDWLNGKRIRKFRKSIAKADWDKENNWQEKLNSFYQAEIREIDEFSNNGTVYFEALETGVHEFRRKLRWLSIYASALNSAVSLKQSPTPNPRLKKYLVPDIINSPYNQLPVPEDKKLVWLELSKENFYALSWLIDQLGDLKDQGLTFLALEDALKACNLADTKTDLSQAVCQYLGLKTAPVKKILDKASQLTTRFYKDGVLKDLILS